MYTLLHVGKYNDGINLYWYIVIPRQQAVWHIIIYWSVKYNVLICNISFFNNIFVGEHRNKIMIYSTTFFVAPLPFRIGLQCIYKYIDTAELIPYTITYIEYTDCCYLLCNIYNQCSSLYIALLVRLICIFFTAVYRMLLSWCSLSALSAEEFLVLSFLLNID